MVTAVARRLTEAPTLPAAGTPRFQEQLVYKLTTLIRDIDNQLNRVSDGSISASLAMTAAPDTLAGTNIPYNVGDVVRNSAPAVVGGNDITYDDLGAPYTAGGNAIWPQYIVYGWICMVAGTPGTWRELRIPVS